MTTTLKSILAYKIRKLATKYGDTPQFVEALKQLLADQRSALATTLYRPEVLPHKPVTANSK